MNSQKILSGLRRWLVFGASGFLSLQMSRAALPAQADAGDFLSLSNSVMTLLQTHDAARFAREITASADDWKSIATNVPSNGDDPIQAHLNGSKLELQKIEAAAKALLHRADSLHLDFSNGDWRPRMILPERMGTSGFPDLQGRGGKLPWTAKMEMVFDPKTNSADAAELKLSVRGLIRFPAGWRSYDGIRWDSFPAGLADEKLLRETAILEKADDFKPLTGQDDPALNKLADTLVRFLRERDVTIYEREALMNVELVWKQFQESGRSGPSREEFEKEIGPRVKDEIAKARGVIQQMEDAGIDLKNSEIAIEQISVGHVQKRTEGSLEGMMGTGTKLRFSVKSDAKAKSGASLSGDYVIGIQQISRFGDEWRILSDIRLEELPAGVVDEKTLAAMKFENYVAEHRALPPGAAAPDIEFVTLDGEKKMKLSDLRGKVVVLDFWATWCGPCQQPMADLQELQRDHPDWKEKVAIVPLSIDDEIGAVRNHVNKRGWTNTFNVWAGDGGWRSAPAKTFHVTGVPTTYVLDREGKVVVAGHPMALRIEDQVKTLLSRPAK